MNIRGEFPDELLIPEADIDEDGLVEMDFEDVTGAIELPEEKRRRKKRRRPKKQPEGGGSQPKGSRDPRKKDDRGPENRKRRQGRRRPKRKPGNISGGTQDKKPKKDN
jgi:hypothetical protein